MLPASARTGRCSAFMVAQGIPLCHVCNLVALTVGSEIKASTLQAGDRICYMLDWGPGLSYVKHCRCVL